MSSTLPPPPPSTKARNPRRSPRSVATKLKSSATSSLPTKKLNFNEVDEDSSFLAGFSESLKFPDDDSWAWADEGNANPFRAAAPAPAVAAPTTSSAAAPAPAVAAPTTSLTDAPTSAAPTYQFTSVFESNDPLEAQSQVSEVVVSEVVVSEATTTVGSNLLADKLLANMNSSPNDNDDCMSSDQPMPLSKKVLAHDNHLSKKVDENAENNSKKVAATVRAPFRKWSRGKYREEMKRLSHGREKDKKSNDEVNRHDQVEKEAQVHAAVPVRNLSHGKVKEELQRRSISNEMQKDRKSNSNDSRHDQVQVEEEAQVHDAVPVRNWSRGKVKEELQRRYRSISRVRQKDRKSNHEVNRHDQVQVEEVAQVHSDEGGKMKEDTRLERSHHSRTSKAGEKDIPFLFPITNNNAAEDESTYFDETSFGTNSLTYQDNETLYTEDDSRTFLTPTPTPSSNRSRYSRRSNRLLCGCEDTGRIAGTMESLKGALTDINRSVMQVISPITNVRCYVNGDDNYDDETYDDATYDDATYEDATNDDATYDDATYDDATYDDATYDDDVRPSRRRSQQHVKQRSKSVSVRRHRESSTTRSSRRGKSCDPPRRVTSFDF